MRETSFLENLEPIEFIITKKLLAHAQYQKEWNLGTATKYVFRNQKVEFMEYFERMYSMLYGWIPFIICILMSTMAD